MTSQINQFKIVNLDNNKGLKFHYAESFGNNITINSVSIPAAGQAASQNYVANFGGFKQIINVSFVLFNDGTDKSTDASNKIKLSEQEDHLLDNVIQGNSTGQSNVTYQVTVWRDGLAKTYEGMIEDVSTNATENPLIMVGSFNLQIGQN